MGFCIHSVLSRRHLRIETITEIRYLSPSDATTRYGTGYPAGIIEIITKKPPAT